jgi:hypothetical protein
MKSPILLTLMFWCAIGWPCLAQELPKPPELSPDEIREGTLRTEQLILAWETERLLREALRRESELAERERALALRELDAQKQRTALAEKETTNQKERADFYELAFRQATKGRSAGCTVLKIFTLGLGRCA